MNNSDLYEQINALKSELDEIRNLKGYSNKDKVRIVNKNGHHEVYIVPKEYADRAKQILDTMNSLNDKIKSLDNSTLQDTQNKNEKKENRPVLKFIDILKNINTASLEDIDEQLKLFCGKEVEINGVKYKSYTDPLIAEKLNLRYRELTGKNHEIYDKFMPKVLDFYLDNKEVIAAKKGYKDDYFNYLNKIKNSIISNNNSKDNKKVDPVLTHTHIDYKESNNRMLTPFEYTRRYGDDVLFKGHDQENRFGIVYDEEGYRLNKEWELQQSKKVDVKISKFADEAVNKISKGWNTLKNKVTSSISEYIRNQRKINGVKVKTINKVIKMMEDGTIDTNGSPIIDDYDMVRRVG